MIAWRYFIVFVWISPIIVGCSNSANLSNSSLEKNQQVLQENNVSQLLSAAKTQQKVEEKVAGLLQQGNHYLDTQHYHDALKAYNQAIAIKGNNVDLWINRGDALTELNRNEEALKSYEKAIAIQPNQDKAWFNQGNALTNLKRYKEAVKSYDEAIAVKPDKEAAWINRGIALTRLKKYKEALKSYDQAIAINPKSDKAYYNKACNYAQQNNLELTLLNLEKAIQLVPDKYRKLARTDSDLAKVRKNQKFQQLINQKLSK